MVTKSNHGQLFFPGENMEQEVTGRPRSCRLQAFENGAPRCRQAPHAHQSKTFRQVEFRCPRFDRCVI